MTRHWAADAGRFPRSLSVWGKRTITLAVRSAALFGVAALIGFYAVNLEFLSLQAQNVVMLSRLEVSLAPGAVETIGRQELLQSDGSDGAELRHIELRNADGVVTLRNVARQRRAFLSYRNYTSYSTRWKLDGGDVVTVGNAQLMVDSASPEQLSFMIGGRKISVVRGVADVVTTIGGKVPEVCKPMGLEEQIQQIFAGLFSGGEGHVVFFLGGQIDCRIGGSVHLSMVGVPWRGLSIVERNDGWYLAPGDPPGFPTPAFRIASKSKTIHGFNEIEWPVTAAADGEGYGALSRITIGRTTYAIELGTANAASKTVRLAFIPERRVHRLEVDDSIVIPQQQGACPEPKPAPPKGAAPVAAPATDEIEPHEAFQWKPRTGVVRLCTPAHRVMSFPRNSAATSALDSTTERLLRWGIIAAAAVFAVFVLFDKLRAAMAFRGVRRWIAPVMAAAIVAAVFAAALSPELASRLGYDLGLKQALLINAMAWFAASVAVFAYGGVGVAGGVTWFSFVGLVLLGTLVQFSLALDAPTTRWVIQIQKHKLMFLDFVPLAVVLVMLAPHGRMVALLRIFVADRTTAGMLCRTVPAYLLLGGLLFWFFRGNQQGVEGFQPVEFGKIAVVAILALLAVGLERIQVFSKRSPRSPWVLLFTIGGPLLVIAFAAWQLGAAGITSLYVVALSHEYVSAGILVAALIGLAVLGFVGRADYLAWLVLTVTTLAIFGGALLIVPVLKKDFSPILIMIVVTIVICVVSLAPWPVRFFRALRWKLRIRRAAPARFAPKPKGMPRGTWVAVAVIGVIALFGFALYQVPGMAKTSILGSDPLPAKTKQLLPRLEVARTGFFRTPIERVITWYDLDHTVKLPPPQQKGPADGNTDQKQATLPVVQYPDLGFQVLRSKEALAHAMCGLTGLDYAMVHYLNQLIGPIYRFVADDCSPLSRLTRLDASYGIEELVRVPVIQNDFIGTYIVARFGLGAGIGTLFFQGLALVGLLALAIKLHPSPELDDGSAAVRRFLSIVMVGTTAVLGCQWLIAWANCLGLLPVMGQPMTFAAAATSHHLLLGLPILVLAAVGMRVAQHRPIRISRAPPEQGWR
jgi:cell division protein FtsW (lipid II flippase)